MDDNKLLSANKRCYTGAELRALGLTYYRIKKLRLQYGKTARSHLC